MVNYGWIGKILQVDLTGHRVSKLDTKKYAEAFIGGRGVAARIAWEELPPNVDAFDPENRLIFMTGPLTGTLAPTCGGRMVVCGAAPQAYPTTHYTRSNMGGFWGAELKYAGYDGVVVYGQADEHVYIWVDNGKVEIVDAKDLWGLDTFETQEALFERHGRGTRVVCIGPAGENLVRIAVIHSEIENAAGQGGFGAVMGSKNLKAIAVRGAGEVAIARPKEFVGACRYVKKMAQTSRGSLP
ncbi:MAG: aldehyde:ferredoxin oxidoreductase, partial [Candidatus Bathyarchaeota archaeon]|nr:aldehyde:ferredoxin oxidoreductase [Candidatus Bathyarchaeota archaeon]